MYHHILQTHEKKKFGKHAPIITSEMFAEQMKLLHEHGYITVSLEQLEQFVEGKAMLPRNSVVITFDDGYLRNFTYAYPILKKYNYKTTIFTITGNMNVDPHKLANRVEIDQIESFIKIVVLSCNNFEELSERITQLDVTIHYHSAEDILDITYKEVNKMAALEQSGLSLETFICFGNDMNDLPLFQKAHHSVVIGEYEPLLMIAKDQILVDEQVEKNIISKLQELSTIFG